MKTTSFFSFFFLLFSNLGYAQSVTIDEQVWMSQNLNVDKFRNGDLIPEAKTDEEWENAAKNKQPAWCYYNNDPANGAKYGRLYNFYAVEDPRGLAPKGWHVPDNIEWKMLQLYLEAQVSQKLKSKKGWDPKKNGGEVISRNGTNSSGFNAVPGGFRDQEGIFDYGGVTAAWWTSDSHGALKADCIYLFSDDDTLMFSSDENDLGLSVRCVKD